jgi:peptidoglycan/LPS O-acetylase OafA/YrhL
MLTFSNAFLPAKACFFLVGGLTYVGVTRPASVARASLFCLLPIVTLGFLWWKGTGRIYESILPVIIWGGVIIAVRFDRLRPVRFVLNSRPLQLLGRISYSTYLFHAPVIFLLQAVIWHWVKPSSTGTLLLWTTASAIPATLLISWISWRTIELPFQRWGSRYKRANNSRARATT